MLQYYSGFCHTLTWISHGCICAPHPEPPSHLPCHPIPQGNPSAPALSPLSHASNLDWRSVSHIIIYMFLCYSLKSSHLTFSRRVQNTVLTSVSLLHRRRQWQPTPVLLPRKSHGRRSLVGCSPRGHEESDMTERLHFHFSLSCIGEGNGNPLQCSCLENSRDRGAWGAAVYGVAQSRTRLKWLSSSSSSSSNSSFALSHIGSSLPSF